MSLRFGVVLVSLASLMGWQAAVAGQWTGVPNEVAVIDDGEGVYRCLLKTDDLLSLDHDVAVARAVLVLESTGNAVARKTYLSLSPITRSWSAGTADWFDGWTEPGGDFDHELSARAEVDFSRGTSTAVFDITPIVKEWLESDQACYGLILTTQPRSGRGLHGQDVERLAGGLAAAIMTIDYRAVPPMPRRRG